MRHLDPSARQCQRRRVPGQDFHPQWPGKVPTPECHWEPRGRLDFHTHWTKIRCLSPSSLWGCQSRSRRESEPLLLPSSNETTSIIVWVEAAQGDESPMPVQQEWEAAPLWCQAVQVWNLDFCLHLLVMKTHPCYSRVTQSVKTEGLRSSLITLYENVHV